MIISTQTHYLADLVLHALAHMHVNNASNLYSEKYISIINEEKGTRNFPIDLEKNMEHLSIIYDLGFERLALVNFMPFFVQDLSTLNHALLSRSCFSEKDKTAFLIPFLDLLKNEDAFYLEYWTSKMNARLDTLAHFEEMIHNLLEKVPGFSSKITFPICISLQLSMTQAGRATMLGDTHLTAVPYPYTEKDFLYSAFQVIHELTHYFTDPLLDSQLSMKDGTHMQSEYLVMVSDYLVLLKYLPDLVGSYLEFADVQGEGLQSVLSKFPVNDDMLATLKTMFLL